MEFVFIAPFAILLLLAVLDLRTFISARTELARLPYTVAEAIADAADATDSPMGEAVARLRDRLERPNSAGAVGAAVVVRGSVRHDGSVCAADDWCPPQVAAAWPAPGSDEGAWAGSDGRANLCASGLELPAPGTQFGSERPVLVNEGGDPDRDGPLAPRPEREWPSRNLTGDEWWVVVATCFDPGPGVTPALELPFALERRSVWGSVHDLGDCVWCRTP